MNSDHQKQISRNPDQRDENNQPTSKFNHRQHLIRGYWIRRGCSVEFKNLGVQSIWDEDEQADIDIPIFRILKIWDRKTNESVYTDPS